MRLFALKYRIVGILFILSLLGIFSIYIIQYNQMLIRPIPLMPLISNSSIPPSPPFKKFSDNLVEIPDTWSLEIGVFSSKKMADHLIEYLRRAGFQAYEQKKLITDINAESKSPQIIEAVFVGPEFEEETLNSIQKTLETKLGIRGKKVPFYIKDIHPS